MTRNSTLRNVLVGIASIAAMATAAHAAPDGSVSMSACPAVEVEITDIAGASGFGGHVSNGAYDDGYGGTNAECHLVPSGSSLSVFCYDGYQNASNHTNQFRLDLGARANILKITYTVSERGVNIEATRIATNPYTSEAIPYTTNSFFPLRTATGFCSQSTLYWKANGVLSGSTSRTGSGYTVNVSTL